MLLRVKRKSGRESVRQRELRSGGLALLVLTTWPYRFTSVGLFYYRLMELFLFALALFVSTYLVIKVDEHINWFKSYLKIAEDQKDDRERERIYR